jgi:nickel/cobalt exporter
MDLTTVLLQEGPARAWLFIPLALVLGALHGLEPGHSKTLMAAFIVAIRGTARQAALLGLCTAFSHSLVIWGLAAIGLAGGKKWNVEATEPYFLAAAGILVIASACWMAWRTRREIRAEAAFHAHSHEHSPGHPHAAEYQDAHEKSHAVALEKKFASRRVTTGQIMLFGFSGGLLPCPAALSVLLLCLQLREFTLGFVLVLSFSVGLALVLVALGVAAAWGARHASRRFNQLMPLARRAPYFSAAVLLLMGGMMLASGLRHLV